MLSIQHNSYASYATSNLAQQEQQLQRSTERLSTGYRINSARDDAAGLQISSRIESQRLGLQQAVRNASDGLSVTQTIDGALGETTRIIQSMRTLAIQSLNGINSLADHDALNKEFQALALALDGLAKKTEFNGKPLLPGSYDETFLVGANNGQDIAINDLDARANKLGGYTLYAYNSVNASERYGANDLHYSVAGDTGPGAPNLYSDGTSYSRVKIQNSQPELQAFFAGGTMTLNGVDFTGPYADSSEFFDAINTANYPVNNAPVTVQSNGEVSVTSLFQPSAGSSSFTINGQTITVDIPTYDPAVHSDPASPTYGSENEYYTRKAVAQISSQLSGVSVSGVYDPVESGAMSLTFSDSDDLVLQDISSLFPSLSDGHYIPRFTLFAAGEKLSNLDFEPENIPSLGMRASSRSLETVSSITLHSPVPNYTGYTYEENYGFAMNSSRFNSKRAIEVLDIAMGQIHAQRSAIAGKANAFTSASDNLNNMYITTSAAQSRIQDTDFASETAKLTSHQIVQQSALAVLTQAQQAPNMALALLNF